MTIRIVLADDHEMVRAGLVLLLKTEPDIEVVGEANNGQEAIHLARTVHPDVVVMDVQMPGLDGVGATKTIVADGFCEGPPIRVLILTTFQIDETAYAAIRAGASGYVVKQAAPGELVTALRAVAGGDAWVDPVVLKKLLTEFASRPDPHTPTPAELGELTPRESEILVEVAHGFSNSEIAERLVVGEATVKTHLSRVLLKLGLRDRAQVVGAAYRSGYVRPSDCPPRPANANSAGNRSRLI